MKLFKLLKAYLDKRKYSGQGIIKQRASKKDYQYKNHFVVTSSTNQGIDLRDKLPIVRDQRDTNACTGFAVGALCEYLLTNEYSEAYRPVSPLYNWYYGKLLHGDGRENKNDGVWLRNSLKALFKNGFVYEQTFPFNKPYTRMVTSSATLIGNMVNKLYFGNTYAYYLLNKEREVILDALDKKYPVVFGLHLNNSFYGNTNGVILNEPKNSLAHAMLIVGYDSIKQHYIVRNSWGSSWGDKGYCYIPYDYVEKNGFDFWTVRRKI